MNEKYPGYFDYQRPVEPFAGLINTEFIDEIPRKLSSADYISEKYIESDITRYSDNIENKNYDKYLIIDVKSKYGLVEENPRKSRNPIFELEKIEGNTIIEEKYKKINLLGQSALRLYDIELNDNVRSNPGFDLRDARYELFPEELDTAKVDRERKAHKFRSMRMRIGGLGKITRILQDEGSARLKSGISRMIRRADDLVDGTLEDGERHRLYAPLITALYAEPSTREMLISGVDKNVQVESDALKAEAINANGEMTMDWLVIGSGVHGAIASAELRSLLPDERIVMVDKSEKMGGQFANYGERPVFYGNSRANRRQQTGTIELPGNDGNINSFGLHAPVQLPDLTKNTYWTNVEMADAIKLNGYLSAEAMQSTDVLGVEYVTDDNSDGYYKVEMKDLDSGEIMSVKVKNIVVTAGLGERIALSPVNQDNTGYLSAEELLTRFADRDNDFPMDEFVNKSVAVIGGGDSARISLELFARLAPDDAYGKSTVQFGSGPDSIDWYGVEFADRDGFSNTTRPRYSQLASFIDRDSSKDDLIHPKQNTKVTKVEPTEDGQMKVYYRNFDGVETSEVYDYVVDATTLVSKVTDPFDSIEGNPVAVVGDSSETRVGFGLNTGNQRTLGKQLSGHRIVFAGPVAKSPLTSSEQATFATGIRENTAAIWANSPRTVSLMQLMASKSAKRNFVRKSANQKISV